MIHNTSELHSALMEISMYFQLKALNMLETNEADLTVAQEQLWEKITVYLEKTNKQQRILAR